MKEYDHFEKYEWVGLFWVETECLEKENSKGPESHIEFPGKLSYNIENGVQLDFMCPITRRIKKSRHIYGVLENGEKCTLFGDFDPDRFGAHFGKISIYKAKITFESVVFGIHITTEDKFDGISMDFTNFQEFCHPQGFLDWAQYSEDPIFKESYEDIEISLVNNAKFKPLEFHVDTLFYCKNKEVDSEIKSVINEIIEKHKNENIFTRTDIGWELLLKNKKGLTIIDAIKSTLLLEQLLSLLIFSPTRRTKLNLLKPSEEQPGFFRYIPILTSLFDISRYKEKILKIELSHMHIPITRINIDFGNIVKNWLVEHKQFQMYAFTIFNKFGRTTEPEIRSEIIVNLAQIESIAQSLGEKKKTAKYDTPILHYDKGQISSTLRKSLKLSETQNIGSALSELRGDIAHFGRPVTRSKKKSLSDLHTVQKCLSIIICSSIYEKLKIPEQNIAAFQEWQLPKPFDPTKYLPKAPIEDNKTQDKY